MKTCSFCGETKPAFEFSKRTKEVTCKSCTCGYAYQAQRNERRRLDRIANPERYQGYQQIQKQNPNYLLNSRIAGAKRRAVKLQATPPWLTAEHYAAIKAVYQRAAELTRLTGISHEVDHVVPLQGATVSGLHVPWNLQPLDRSSNATKGNRLDWG